MNKKYLLNGKWNLCFTMPDDGKVVETQACVPGNVEPVLVELGLVNDYMPADNERAMEKFEAVDDWCYTTQFDMPDCNKKHEIVFEGIDTIADIYLNGEHILFCNNMHLEYRANISNILKRSGNILKVIIRSSQLWAREYKHDMYATTHSAPCSQGFYDSQSYLRKARHQWGWDNAPRLLTSGIFRSVYIEEIPSESFEEVYLYTVSIDEKSVNLGANWIYKTDAKTFADHKIRLSLLDKDKIVFSDEYEVFFMQGSIKYSVPKKDIELWWPVGFGEAKLYTVRLEMLVGEEVSAEYEAPFGIRTLLLERTEDILEDGTGEFVFRINGEKVFIRGTNWKPLHPLASIADIKTKEGKALEEVKKLNCNMVRIWGGGIYEDEYFFDYCDREGIMIWQDFMLACEIPVTDEWYCMEIEKEAVQAVKRYRNHPSLATWCGDNENDECMTWVNYHSQTRPSHSVITRKVLKKAVLYHDPYRTYVDSSPYSSDTNYLQRKSDMTHFQPEKHLYATVENYAEKLRECKSFFIGETGPIQLNAAAINKEIFQREKQRTQRLWNSPRLATNGNHQNDGYFTYWRNAGADACKKFYGRDFTLEEWDDYALAVNILCAEVFKDAIEYSRVTRWSKTGVIWWSLIDMWPMLFNYSVIDHEFNKKLPYHWIRQSQQEFALMCCRVELGGELNLYAVNDTLKTHTVEYTVTAYDEACKGKVIASGICKQAPNSTTLIQRIAEDDKPQLWIITWKENGREYTNHVFTGFSTYETTREWTRIIGKHGGFTDEILELKD